MIIFFICLKRQQIKKPFGVIAIARIRHRAFLLKPFYRKSMKDQ
jgi:hypothetical protein